MSTHDDTASRHTSISKRAPSTTASRAQTLIKRNIAVNDLKPSDILIERFQAWKHIVKMLIAYFEGVADIENNTARELTKLGSVIQVPFKAGNQFLGEGGMQDVFYNIRDRTRTNADHHANFAKTVEGSIVQHLQKLRMEIKAHVKNVQNDTGKLAASVARERELSMRLVNELSKGINQLRNSPMGVMSRDDPYCQNVLVSRQLQKQVNEENALQKSIIMMQHSSANFEEGIVRSIQSAWQTFDEWQTRMIGDVQESWRALAVAMGGVSPTREWVAFAGRSDHLLDPDTPLRNPDTIEYPGKEDASVVPVHLGLLERKKRFTRSYAEGFFVLTPAGYLHEYASSDPHTHVHPVFSLFLPACTLGPPSSARTSKSHKFHIEIKRDQTPGAGRFHIGSKEIAYTFRARSHDEMMEWWNDVRMLVARYLVASEAIERHGPVEAAVRAAGYLSEGEDDEEEEEGGSSLDADEGADGVAGEEDEEAEVDREEGEEEEEENEHYEVAQESTAEHEAAPAYTAPAKATPLPMGANGYPLDKKYASLPTPAPDSDTDHVPITGAFPLTPAKTATTLPSQAPPESEEGPIADTTDLQRRISRRQEKAPEGRAPKRPLSVGEDLMPAPAPALVTAPRATKAVEKTEVPPPAKVETTTTNGSAAPPALKEAQLVTLSPPPPEVSATLLAAATAPIILGPVATAQSAKEDLENAVPGNAFNAERGANWTVKIPAEAVEEPTTATATTEEATVVPSTTIAAGAEPALAGAVPAPATDATAAQAADDADADADGEADGEGGEDGEQFSTPPDSPQQASPTSDEPATSPRNPLRKLSKKAKRKSKASIEDDSPEKEKKKGGLLSRFKEALK